MHTLYILIAGPLAWIALALFLGGLLYRLIQTIYQVNRKERFILSAMSLKFGLRSIAHWIIPFGTVNWRRHPVVTVMTFCFHLSLLITPLFLSAHYILVADALGWHWWVMPNGVADFLSVVVIGACLFFALRRITRPEVRYVTRASDYLLLCLVAAPFVTGLAAHHHIGAPMWVTIIHMFSGEVLLAIIPFSRLSHMIFSILTRSYMGSEFGKVRRARDW